MKKYVICFSLLAVVALLSACSESSSEQTYLDVDKTTIIIPAEGGTETLRISSNSSWSIRTDNPNLSISPMSGSGNADVKVSLPGTWDTKENSCRLTINTSDGAVIKNVVVTQRSKYLEGAIMKVTNHVKEITFGGEARHVDSLVILSNIPWQLKGPEWIEVYNGTRWVALSPTKAVFNSGNDVKLDEAHTVQLRTLARNESDDNMVGTLSLTPIYEGDTSFEIEAVQLGRYGVVPDRVLNMCHSIACAYWKVGVGVDRFAAQMTNSEFTDEELTDEEVNSWEIWDLDEVCSVGGLEAGREYFIYTAGIDKNGKYHLNHRVIKTQPNVNQANVAIENVEFDGNRLAWDTKMNEYCAGYLQIAINNLMDASDALLAFLLYSNNQEVPRYQESGHFVLRTDNKDAQILTWGIAKGSNTLSGLLGRYKTHYYNSAPARNGAQAVPVLKKVSNEDLKNAIIDVQLVK